MIIRAKEGKEIFLVCLLVFRCETLMVQTPFHPTQHLCTASDVHKLHPIFLGRKLLCLASPPSKASSWWNTLLVQTVFYPTWHVSWNTQALHRTIQQTFPINVNTISGGRKCYKGRNRLLCSGYRASSRWKHWLPPSPPVTTRHTHLFHETHTLTGTTHPIFATGLRVPSSPRSLPPHHLRVPSFPRSLPPSSLCVPSSPRSLPSPNRPMCHHIPTLSPSLQPAIVSKADVDQTRINPKLLHFPPTIAL